MQGIETASNGAPVEIFILRQQRKFGPYSLEEVQEHIRLGTFTREDVAWWHGLPDFVRIDTIPGLHFAKERPTKKNRPLLRALKRSVSSVAGFGFLG